MIFLKQQPNRNRQNSIKILMSIIIIYLSQNSYSQSFITKSGIGFSYATSNAMGLDFLYIKNDYIFKLGGTFQFSDKRGKRVEDQLSNYGQTTDGTGEYFYTIDFGVGKVIKGKWTIDTELSIGANQQYTNFVDRRFNDDGYHIVTGKESIIGFGLSGGYIVNETWHFFTGYNTNREIQFGARILITTEF